MADVLTYQELAAVLAHEAAHIRRHDFAKHCLYEAMAMPIALHPAAWFTRERVVESREMVCDAMAAPALGGGEMFAQCLLRLASLLVAGDAARVPHAIGMFDANELERRLAMLTNERVERSNFVRWTGIAACVAVGLGTCATAVALRLDLDAGSAPAAAQGTGKPRVPQVSGGVMAGVLLTRVPPVYPPEAKEKKVSGSVVLHAVIGTDGLVSELTVVAGPEMLRQSALNAVKQWTYKPFLLNGQPTAVSTTITVHYSLEPNEPPPAQ